MTPRQRRMVAIGLVLAGLAVATTLALTAFNDNLLFYYTPSQVAQGEAPSEGTIRVGGLVVTGSVQRNPESLAVSFALTDMAKNVPIVYAGILPDLFREGQGVIAQGRLREDGVFEAVEVLAKHDERYMPPEVADSLAKVGEGPYAPVQNPGSPAP